MNPGSAKAIKLVLAAPAPPPAADPLLSAFTTVVDRLEAVLDRETASLSQRLPLDYAETNRQKRQGMLELSRLLRGFRAAPPGAEVYERLARLSKTLDRNRAVLDVQLRAVREIADIVAKVIRDADSDGTYSLRAGWQ